MDARMGPRWTQQAVARATLRTGWTEKDSDLIITSVWWNQDCVNNVRIYLLLFMSVHGYIMQMCTYNCAYMMVSYTHITAVLNALMSAAWTPFYFVQQGSVWRLSLGGGLLGYVKCLM